MGKAINHDSAFKSLGVIRVVPLGTAPPDVMAVPAHQHVAVEVLNTTLPVELRRVETAIGSLFFDLPCDLVQVLGPLWNALVANRHPSLQFLMRF